VVSAWISSERRHFSNRFVLTCAARGGESARMGTGLTRIANPIYDGAFNYPKKFHGAIRRLIKAISEPEVRETMEIA